MAKKKSVKGFNGIARDLRTPKFRSRTVQSKKVYSRKKVDLSFILKLFFSRWIDL